MNMAVLAIVLVAYFGVMIAVGFLGRKYADSYDSFISAGRNCGTLMIIGSAVGSQIGNGFVVGGAGGGAATGLSGAWYGIACGLGYLCIGLLLNKVIYKKGYISLPEFLEERYGDKKVSVVFSVATVCSYIGNIAAQIMAGSALFKAFGLSPVLGAVVITIVVLLYSSMSGLWGAFATSVIQVGIILVALIATFIVVIANGGIGLINAAIASGAAPADYWSLGNQGASYIIVMIGSVCLAALCDQQTVQRINSAKSEKASFNAHMWATLICVVCALLPAIIGMYGFAVYGDTSNSVFFTVAINNMPSVVGAIIIAAVIAAIMSTIDSMLIGFSTVALKNIYKGMINPNVSDKTLKRGDLIVSVVVCAIALILSFSSDSIIGLLENTYLFLTACCLVPFVGGLFWKKGTAKGALISSIVGLVLVLLSLCNIYSLPNMDLMPIGVAIIVYVVVSLVDKEGQKA